MYIILILYHAVGFPLKPLHISFNTFPVNILFSGEYDFFDLNISHIFLSPLPGSESRRLQEVLLSNLFLPRQVRNGSRHLSDPVMCSRSQLQAVIQFLHDLLSRLG